jgi:hypothetical protein
MLHDEFGRLFDCQLFTSSQGQVWMQPLLWPENLMVCCYPRHNGNILIDTVGHCVHIDFGFMLSNSPGSVGFELAPFKLSAEYIEILGGMDSPLFERFVEVLTEAFLSLRKKADWIVGLVEMMESGKRFTAVLMMVTHPLIL